LAFCFLTAMRALFKMDIIKLNKYEKQLINSFSEKKTPFFNLKENLAKSYYELRSLKDSKGQVFFDIKNPPTNNFHDLMIIYSKRSRPTDNIKLISEKLFYQNFWHSLFPLNTKLNPLHKGSISFIIKFDDKNKRMPESSFPYKIAQMIYNLSFK